ncbi:hypothetical protein [Pseudonocardia asaccharolytica]|uniref:PIN domain-containing protein n=1 Tax=Pseudonocardia asaccharolytica DSM 44247 = NBRC 16224 TaxID=1123024 RepID=A0A511D0Y0_9PSEU|nr:hypothetical protein [Pseudonocardia asaccharolytica]GEL16538.1 hypothetical protein PA7_03750 [Pseudonocardia asaccharolytica DSM 44247 = NBRC 16224]
MHERTVLPPDEIEPLTKLLAAMRVEPGHAALVGPDNIRWELPALGAESTWTRWSTRRASTISTRRPTRRGPLGRKVRSLAFPAFLDTCVLFPQYLTDTLLAQADAGTFRPLWSRDVLEELGQALEHETRMTARDRARGGLARPACRRASADRAAADADCAAPSSPAGGACGCGGRQLGSAAPWRVTPERSYRSRRAGFPVDVAEHLRTYPGAGRLR